jgi:crotonobetainyl-CoA:carnitine CoA-transferase CaiB-like acyl-CoA transferase
MYQPGPLEGVRILDFSHVLSGPFATMLLADLGAEIIKIEIPGRGDSTRLSGPPFQKGMSAYFVCVNRNKKSLCLDLKKKEGVEVAKRLVKDCDVVVESFRPRVMKGLGLGYETMKQIKRDIIYASLSAFGPKGPYKERPGFEFIIQGITGLVSIQTEPGRRPFKIQIQLVDLCAGMFLAHAILGALYHRQRTGQGQKVEVSLLEGTTAMLAHLAGIYFMTGKVPVGLGTKNPVVMPSQGFRTKDSYVAVVTQPQHWEKFCKALGKPEWIKDEKMSKGSYRVEHYEEMEKKIEEVMTTRTTAEWIRRFDEQEIAAGPFNTVEQCFQDPQVKAMGIVKTVKHPKVGSIKLLKQPWTLSETPGGIRLPPPVLGEHTIQVLKERGFSKKEIQELGKKGVIYNP